jgi:hypothetical protein
VVLQEFGFKPGVPKRLKLALDGASKTRRSKFVSVTLEPLDSPPSLLYSETNARLLGFFWGPETEANLRTGLVELANELVELSNAGNKIQVPCDEGETLVDLEFFLGCDMVCLAKILGFNAVYHPSSTYKCIWCKVKKENLADFSIPTWPLRRMADLIKVGKAQCEKKNPSAIDGIMVRTVSSESPGFG